MAFKHVLVPTDFSEPGNPAVRYAMEEATLHGAKVTLLHVEQSSSAATDIYYVSGPVASGLEAGYDVVAGGRLGTAPAAEPTVVRHDFVEEALTRLRDLVPGSFQGEWAVEIAEGRPADAIRARDRLIRPLASTSVSLPAGRVLLLWARLLPACGRRASRRNSARS